MSAVRRRAQRLLGIVLGSLLALVAATGPAAAHDVLRSTNPKDGATVDQTPAAVVLTFDEPAIAMGTQIVVTGPGGPVGVGPPKLVDTTVTQPLSGGAPAGSYQVEWRVTSADGHPVSGTFRFTSRAAGAGQPSATGATATPAPVQVQIVRVPWIVLVVVVVVVVVGAVIGLVLARRRRTARTRR